MITFLVVVVIAGLVFDWFFDDAPKVEVSTPIQVKASEPVKTVKHPPQHAPKKTY
jgi:hypothetical protein